jgi:heat shock protein HslJ
LNGAVRARGTTIAAVVTLATLMPGPGVAVAQSVARQEVQAVTAEDAAAARYFGIYDEAVTLVDGSYEGEPFVEGGASRPTVGLIDRLQFEADMDGDGVAERFVFLWETSGGSGTNMYLARVHPTGDAYAVFLGNRVHLRGVTPLDGEVLLALLRPGADDAMCCPGELALQLWRTEGLGLAQERDEIEGRLGLEALAGEWEWRPSAAMLRDQVAWAPATVLIQADGTVSGNAPCNYLSGVLEFEEPNFLRAAPIAATQRLCEAPTQAAEDYFLPRLQAVEGVGWNMGRLALYWTHEDQYGFLLFARR